MKVFFDSNVYVAEALLGQIAEAMLEATVKAGWRILVSEYVLDETVVVMTEQFGFSKRLGRMTRKHVLRRAKLVKPRTSKHRVVEDPKDSPILQAALISGADYLVTNDKHLLSLHPHEGLEIISMSDYHQRLVNQGLLKPAKER